MGLLQLKWYDGLLYTIPEEYFKNSTPVELSEENTVQPASQYAKTLCSFMNSLRYTIPCHPKKQPTYINPLFFWCSQVFVRIDSVKSPQQRPYSGPHFVLERHNKYFVIEKDGHTDTVTIDCLKPAFVDPKSPIDSSDEEELLRLHLFHPNLRVRMIILWQESLTNSPLITFTPAEADSLPNPYVIAIKFYRYLVRFNIFI